MAKWWLILLLLPLPAPAADWAYLTWQHPTNLTNGLPLAPTAILGTRIEYGPCEAGQFPVLNYSWFSLMGLQTHFNLDNLAPGAWCFRLKTYSTYGTSAPSATVQKTITAGPCESCHG